MPTVVACECGARLQIPEAARGRRLLCPKCHAPISASDSPPSAMAGPEPATRAGTASELGVQGLCPICQADVLPVDQVLLCPACSQLHHSECWAEVGGCSTYGCAQAPAMEKAQEPTDQPTAWGDYKNCPMCGERIRSIAVKCRYCGTTFDTVDPLTVGDLHRKLRKSDALSTTKRWAIALFALSVIGCLAPIMAVVSLVWVLPRRDTLSKAGPFYTVLGYSSIAVSLIYSVLILLFTIGLLFE